jgi:diphosphomevalonate decarboxylase
VTSVTRKIWAAEAPANIALIKYMGKTNTTENRPSNSSFSFTLDHLTSRVELELDSKLTSDTWEPLQGSEFDAFTLSEKGQKRFLKHLVFLKEKFGFRGFFHLRSANRFPSDCGLASSASSFAALTIVSCQALSELTHAKPLSPAQIGDLSRQGSGSSCRSVFTPWAVWTAEGVEAIELPYKSLLHQVVVVNDQIKSVSSSEAHTRVTSSLLFNGRTERAESRLKDLLAALRAQNWADAYQITWAEFWDMHVLFETSQPTFSYMTPGSLKVLQFAQTEFWQKTGDGPLITMDAGPNVHLLYRPDQAAMLAKIEAKFASGFRVLSLDGGK